MSWDISCLDHYAPLFRELTEVDADAVPRYEMLGATVYWSDELPPLQKYPWAPVCIRAVLAHRMQLILDQPLEWQDWWDKAIRLFPEWIGFLPERRVCTDEVLAVIKQGERDVASEIRFMERYGCDPR